MSMANNVFGNPITNSTLEEMIEFVGKKIRRKDKAHVVLLIKIVEHEATNARTYVENLKKQWGYRVFTLILIYNATGDAVNYVTKKHWYDHFGPSPHLLTIANGLWGAFLHIKKTVVASRSVTAVYTMALMMQEPFATGCSSGATPGEEWHITTK